MALESSSSERLSLFFDASFLMPDEERTSTEAIGLSARLAAESITEQLRANPTRLLAAITFGSISPNSRMRNVAATVVNRNSHTPEVNTNSCEIRLADSMVMQIFTRLLMVRIVANVYSFSSSSESMAREAGVCCSPIFSKSVCVSENSEVSEPETNADTSSSTHMPAAIAMTCHSSSM